MVGIECCGNSLGLGTLLILNLHVVSEVVIVIVQMLTPNKSNEEFDKLTRIFGVHVVIWMSLVAAFYGIFNDKPFLMIPQIILQTCVVIVAAVNVLLLISLSHFRILVLTELHKYLPQHLEMSYFHLYAAIVLGLLFVGLYFYFLMVVYGYYKKLKRESRFNKSVSKSSTITEEIIL